MRARKKKWTDEELSTNERVVKNPEGLKGKWSGCFNNSNTIHLEIGCGKGKFVTTLAKENADINFVALERQKHVLSMASRLAEKESLVERELEESGKEPRKQEKDSGKLENLRLFLVMLWIWINILM